jgi:hypothetical protein
MQTFRGPSPGEQLWRGSPCPTCGLALAVARR